MDEEEVPLCGSALPGPNMEVAVPAISAERERDLRLGEPDRSEATAEQKVALAKAVMDHTDRRVLIINEDNGAEEWLPIGEAVATGSPYVASFRWDMIGFDGDQPNSIDCAFELAEEMLASGLRAVAWASGRPGHAQVLVRCSSLAEQRHWRQRAKALGFDWRRRSRAPLSPHRHELQVRLLLPNSIEEAIDRLGSPVVRRKSGKLTPRTMALLRNGDPSSNSDSEVTMRICIGAVATGVPIEKLIYLMAIPANKGGASYRKRAETSGQPFAEKWLRDFVWPRAEEYLAKNPPIRDAEDARAELRKVREEAAQFEWTKVEVERLTSRGMAIEKVSVSSLRKGLEGILWRAERQGSIHITLSNRVLAKEGNLSKHTAFKVLKILQRQGWITEVIPSTVSRAGTYRVEVTGKRVQNPPPKSHLFMVKDNNSAGESTHKGDPLLHTPAGGSTEHEGQP